VGLHNHKTAAGLAALLLLAAPARGDDVADWWKGYAASTKAVTLPDGKKLSLYCEGKGTPVVMMDAGLGPGGITSWRKVQTAIGRVTKTCAYDRAGIWNSTPTDGPRDAGAEADDLAALLKAARLPAPYVIVAHSYGGYIARLYAGRHTRDVAGLVLLDPSTEHQARRAAEILPDWVKQNDKFFTALRDCTVDPRPADSVKTCARPLAADVPPDMAERFAGSMSPATASAMIREEAAMPALSSELLVREKKSLGAMPFVLLHHDPTKFEPALSAADNAKLEWLGLQLHLETMDISSDAQLQVVPRAGHNIQSDRPDAVIAAVTDMVLKVRRTRK
jgi:pimeloyl-ACP methyl ester carboxylesterase